MNDERGFTLAELLVAIAIVVTVLAAVLTVQQQGQVAYLLGSARAEVQQSGRVALDRMARELRESTQVTAAAGCDTGTSDITFVYYDGASNVTVRYYKNGTNLERVQTTPTAADEVVIGGLQTLTIRCYDAAGASSAVPANIRSVDVTLVTKVQSTVASGTSQDQHDAVNSRVRFRNLL